MTAAQKMIGRQLALRAVIWDIWDMEGVDAAKLEEEMQLFQVFRILTAELQEQAAESQAAESQAVEEQAAKSQAAKSQAAELQAAESQAVEEQPAAYRQKCSHARYMKLYACLCKAGIAEKDALLVTEDAELARYVYDLRYKKQEPDKNDACCEETKDQENQPGMGVVFFEREGSQEEAAADMVVLGFEEIGVQFMDRVLKRRNRIPWNILYTQRTCVREITLRDLDELYRLYDGVGITDYTEPLMEREMEEAYTKSYIDSMYYYYGYGMWVVLDRETGRLIGRAGIEHRQVQDDVLMELGYVIGTEYQKQGYATEVCQAILEYAASELGIEQLHCFIHPHNGGSLRVAEKLGFARCTEKDRKQGELLHFYKIIRS